MEPIVAPTQSASEKLGSLEVPYLAQRFRGGDSFAVGFDVTEKEAEAARQKRLKRFGQELRSTSSSGSGNDEEEAMEATDAPRDLDEPFPADSFPVDLPEGDGWDRDEAVYVFGVNEMSTHEVMKVFQTYHPSHLEWVDDHSCVVVWHDNYSSKRALFALGKWELNRPAAPATRGEDSAGDSDSTEDTGPKRKLIVAPKAEPVSWRVTETQKNANRLLLRLATEGDRKKRGAAKQSDYYRKHGNPHTGQSGAVSLSDLRARSKKRRHDNGDSPPEEVDEVAAATAISATDDMADGAPAAEAAVKTEGEEVDAHLLIEVSNIKQEVDSDVEQALTPPSPRPVAATAAATQDSSVYGDHQLMTIKVEADSDEEEQRMRLRQMEQAEEELERRTRRRSRSRSRSPSPKRTRRNRERDEGRFSQLEKMKITVTVDREAEERERREQQRQQDRLLAEQRHAILERRRQKERQGQKPISLSSVVVRPTGSTALASSLSRSHRSPSPIEFRDTAVPIKEERDHTSAVPTGEDDLRYRLKDRKRGHAAAAEPSSSSGRFKPPARGSLTITCEFEDR